MKHRYLEFVIGECGSYQSSEPPEPWVAYIRAARIHDATEDDSFSAFDAPLSDYIYEWHEAFANYVHMRKLPALAEYIAELKHFDVSARENYERHSKRHNTQGNTQEGRNANH